jgi:hypothetical protein
VSVWHPTDDLDALLIQCMFDRAALAAEAPKERGSTLIVRAWLAGEAHRWSGGGAAGAIRANP